tara:strand:+ start:518 stop:694 length:177 start_codon:yes stop_codon:yes gene_type:complete
MRGPLASLERVEFSGLGPGLLAGYLLAAVGAKVAAVDRKADHRIPAMMGLAKRGARPT